MHAPSAPRPLLRRLAAEHGMVLVLIVLCAVISATTIAEQQPAGRDAGRQVARRILASVARGATVMIAAGSEEEDRAFVAAARETLSAGGARVLAEAMGDPRDARRALEGLSRKGTALSAVACTARTASWSLFADLRSDFPSLTEPRVVAPRGVRWPNFLKAENLLNVANQITVIAIVAIGMTLVIITGGIDLSVGSVIALASVVTGWVMRDGFGGASAPPHGQLAGAAAAVALSGLIGLGNGGVVTAFRVPPFIVTLATMLVASGLAYLVSNGQSINEIPEGFTWLGRGAGILGLPNAVVLMAILYAAAHLLMTRTRWGRRLYAVGASPEAARLSGVPVRRVLLFAYACSGALAGLGGVVLASQLRSGSPTFGQMYELYVIAAVVVGGTSLAGGRGKILGTLTGAFIIAVIQNGMNLKAVEPYTQKVVLGAVILAAVLLDRLRGSAAES